MVRAAIDELAEHGPDRATGAGVEARAGVPPGSFYQYFHGVPDMVAWVLGLMVESKLDHTRDLRGLAGQVPALQYYRAVLAQGLAFAGAHPEFLAISRHLYLSPDPTLRRQLDLGMDRWRQLLADLIRQDQLHGLVRPGLDPDLTAQLLAALLTHTVIEQLYALRPSRTGLEALVDQVIDVLGHGLVP
jgi:AcrR family transcriptional regulator